MNKEIVGMNIKQARKRKKMKQKELAEIIGYTESSISKYEQGLIQIPNTVIDMIARALEVSPVELLGESWDSKSNNHTLGQNIKKYRTKAGLQQKDLAAMVAKSATSIMRYEKDEREPGKETLEKIATALNVNPTLLMDWESPKQKTISDFTNEELLNEIRKRMVDDTYD